MNSSLLEITLIYSIRNYTFTKKEVNSLNSDTDKHALLSTIKEKVREIRFEKTENEILSNNLTLITVGCPS